MQIEPTIRFPGLSELSLGRTAHHRTKTNMGFMLQPQRPYALSIYRGRLELQSSLSKEKSFLSDAMRFPILVAGRIWTDDSIPAHRDVEEGGDPNQDRRNEIIYDLFDRLAKEELLSPELQKLAKTSTQTAVDVLMSTPRVNNSQLMDIIEFGRIIHAEMSAISDAARLGRPTANATLFCTTFPCHICAKHIVAAELNRVVFLEPYPKSYAPKLHVFIR